MEKFIWLHSPLTKFHRFYDSILRSILSQYINLEKSPPPPAGFFLSSPYSCCCAATVTNLGTKNFTVCRKMSPQQLYSICMKNTTKYHRRHLHKVNEKKRNICYGEFTLGLNKTPIVFKIF